MEGSNLVDVSIPIPHPLRLLLLLLLIVLASALVSRIADMVLPNSKLRLPPGPRRWPVVGNLLQLGPFPHRNMARFCSVHGPLVYLRLGAVDAITTDDPDVIREILLHQDDVFASRSRTLPAVHLAYDCADIAHAPLGPRWKRMRRICMEQLLTTRRLDAFAGNRASEVRQLVRDVHDKARAAAAVDLRQVLGAFSMNNVTRMLLGKRYFGPGIAGPAEAAEFLQLTHELFSLLGMIYLGDCLPLWRWIDPLIGCERKMKEVEKKIDEFHQRIIDEHRAGGNARNKEDMDFVDVLLSFPGMDDFDIKALMQDMIAAGTDTSAVASEWAMTEMIKNPRVLQRVQEELERVVGRDRLVEEADLGRLTYLRCVVRETFRLHTVAPFLIPHESVRATKVMGYDIPAKTRVFINTHALGRNARVWGVADVDEFRPERHLLPDEGGEQQRVEINHGPDFKILPFGAGKRKCPGAPLGVVMMLMALATLCHCFDLAPPEGVRCEEIETEEVYGLTMPRAKPLLAAARPRLAPHLYP